MVLTEADTKGKILDAAEELFSERGFPSTTLRAITEQAGVNLAAVNYHFGSKDALIFAVFDRFVVPMNEKRLQLLDDAEAGTGSDGPSLESVVSAFLHPVVRNWKRGDRWPRRMKLMARAMIELGPKSEDLKRHLFAEVARRFLPALARCAPHLGRAELAWRFYFAIGAMNFAFHAHEQSGEPENQLFPLLDEQRVPELLLHHMVNTFQTPALLPSDASEIDGFATGEVER